MPFVSTIEIHPSDLKKILDHLTLIKWNEGMITIKDTGTKYIIRDKDEQHICTVDHFSQDG